MYRIQHGLKGETKEVPTKLLSERMVREGVNAFIGIMENCMKDCAEKWAKTMTQVKTTVNSKVKEIQR